MWTVSLTSVARFCCSFSSTALCLLRVFLAKTSCSDSSSSSGKKKSCSSSATSVDCKLTSMGAVILSSRSLSWTLSFGVSFKRDMKSAAVFCDPATCMMRNLNCST